MIEAAVSMLGSLAGVHSWFTGLRAGALNERMLEEVHGLRSSVERLTEHILYVESVTEVRDLTKGEQSFLRDRQKLSEFLQPVQESLGEDVLSTAVVMTPDKLHQAFNRDPWEVLVEVRPAERTKKPSNPDLVPIIFADSSQTYIGWQTAGALPILFDCEYKPNAHLFLPSGQSSSTSGESAEPIQAAEPEALIDGAGTSIDVEDEVTAPTEPAPDQSRVKGSVRDQQVASRRFPMLVRGMKVSVYQIALGTLFIADLVVPDALPFVDEVLLGLSTWTVNRFDNRGEK